ncbi:phosphate ABC transporter substrate-binding protein PstS [Hippea maritima]|uniref:Phosphate-binding protein n=1 Tax=Hippea maritima (strain ATCC 700847 / DSM 10411 / MH2) TaxID=760142 RepID=F2LVS6_HIPMA|nr:phosphate ABC transporter substrate-binding protein PstS [Hippea maritima]AEA33860.1 phosphate ABC transporter, periplasmic phosphate-binding protein [Hippea maritima DSM 10411]
MVRFLVGLFGLFLLVNVSFAKSSLDGAGATFPYPVYTAWAYYYHQATGKKVNYQGIGSGGGIRQITKRVVDFGGSDEMLSPEELKKRGLFQFPAVVGSIVVVYNLNGVKDGELKLSNKAVCDIFLGKVKYWDNPEIKQLNKNLSLPHEVITVIHRSEGSGTTWNFTYWLSHVCKAWNKRIGYGKVVGWPTGKGAKGNQGVTNYIKQIPGSIGYVEYAYKIQNQLKVAQLQTTSGNFIKPSVESFESAAKQANWSEKDSFYIPSNLLLSKGKNSWPLTVSTMILLANDKPNTNKQVIEFFDWAFKNGDKTAKQLGYVPLPGSVKSMVRDYWKKYVIR